jgi:hypothetical protein
MDALQQLRRRNQRQKSDVAQKLVAMCLHELSARIVDQRPDLRVESDAYITAVRSAFGDACAFCAAELGKDTHVEHLDAMNRVRGGLHVAGNVVLACKNCNNQKRNDDRGRHDLELTGESGWDRFLSHDGSLCESGCKSCAYWRELFPRADLRSAHLASRLELLRRFRSQFGADQLAVPARAIVADLEELYRAWQQAAEDATDRFADAAAGRILGDLR